MHGCSITGWNYLQCSLGSRLGQYPGHSPSPLGRVRRCLEDCRYHSCLESKEAVGTSVRNLHNLHSLQNEDNLTPPPALSVLRMSKGFPQQPHEWCPQSVAGWDVEREYRLVSVQDGALQLCRCTLAPPHAHPLLPDAVNDAFGFYFLSGRPRVMNNVDNTETRALLPWNITQSFYSISLYLLQHQCATCCKDLTDLLPVLFPPCLGCGWAYQWKVASAQGLTWPVGCCLEETRHEKESGGSWQPKFCKTPNI